MEANKTDGFTTESAGNEPATGLAYASMYVGNVHRAARIAVDPSDAAAIELEHTIERQNPGIGLINAERAWDFLERFAESSIAKDRDFLPSRLPAAGALIPLPSSLGTDWRTVRYDLLRTLDTFRNCHLQAVARERIKNVQSAGLLLSELLNHAPRLSMQIENLRTLAEAGDLEEQPDRSNRASPANAPISAPARASDTSEDARPVDNPLLLHGLRGHPSYATSEHEKAQLAALQERAESIVREHPWIKEPIRKATTWAMGWKAEQEAKYRASISAARPGGESMPLKLTTDPKSKLFSSREMHGSWLTAIGGLIDRDAPVPIVQTPKVDDDAEDAMVAIEWDARIVRFEANEHSTYGGLYEDLTTDRLRRLVVLLEDWAKAGEVPEGWGQREDVAPTTTQSSEPQNKTPSPRLEGLDTDALRLAHVDARSMRHNGERVYPGGVLALRDGSFSHHSIDENSFDPSIEKIVGIAIWRASPTFTPGMVRVGDGPDPSYVPLVSGEVDRPTTGVGRVDVWIARADALRKLRSGRVQTFGRLALTPSQTHAALAAIETLVRESALTMVNIAPPDQRSALLALARVADSESPKEEDLTVAIVELIASAKAWKEREGQERESAVPSTPEPKLVRKIGGYTKAEIVEHLNDAAGSFSASTFENIRAATEVEASPRGGKGQQRRFSLSDLKLLKAEVENGKYRNKAALSKALGELIEGSKA